jgi:hypothetical protein
MMSSYLMLTVLVQWNYELEWMDYGVGLWDGMDGLEWMDFLDSFYITNYQHTLP